MKIFNRGIDLFPWDPPLSNNVCYALANLCFKYQPNQKQIFDEGILEKIPEIDRQFLEFPECMKHMTAVINNLCYKSKENKKIISVGTRILYFRVADKSTTYTDWKRAEELQRCINSQKR